MDKREIETRRIALECASRRDRGDVRAVLKDAEVYISWLKGDTTDVAVKIRERFPE